MASKRGKQAVRHDHRIPGWVLFLLGLLLGVLVMGYIGYRGWIPSLRSTAGPTIRSGATPTVGSGPGIAAHPETKTATRFDFYKVLPGKEVIIPDAELSAQARTEKTPPATTQTSAGAYVLQVSSFSTPAQADTAKAKLALAGFVAEIQPVNINGQNWYRVRLGPYASAAQLERVKKKLSTAGFHALALKEKR